MGLFFYVFLKIKFESIAIIFFTFGFADYECIVEQWIRKH